VIYRRAGFRRFAQQAPPRAAQVGLDHRARRPIRSLIAHQRRSSLPRACFARVPPAPGAAQHGVYMPDARRRSGLFVPVNEGVAFLPLIASRLRRPAAPCARSPSRLGNVERKVPAPLYARSAPCRTRRGSFSRPSLLLYVSPPRTRLVVLPAKGEVTPVPIEDAVPRKRRAREDDDRQLGENRPPPSRVPRPSRSVAVLHGKTTINKSNAKTLSFMWPQLTASPKQPNQKKKQRSRSASSVPRRPPRDGFNVRAFLARWVAAAHEPLS